jgi:hypothetical protein
VSACDRWEGWGVGWGVDRCVGVYRVHAACGACAALTITNIIPISVSFCSVRSIDSSARARVLPRRCVPHPRGNEH